MSNSINSTETTITFSNIHLDGDKLFVTKITKIYHVMRKYSSKTGRSKMMSKEELSCSKEDLSFTLTEVTTKALSIYRDSKTPSFVLKKDGKYYYTEIPVDLNLVSVNLLGTHKCSSGCQHFSSATDEDGGCAKVRGFATGIEKYEFISFGYETFNAQHNSFVVIACSNYKKSN